MPRTSAGRALIGAGIAALAAGLLLRYAPPLLHVLIAGLVGGLLGWLLQRRLYGPLGQLRERILRGEAGGGAGEAAESVEALAAAVDRVTTDLGARVAHTETERRHLEEILESMSDGVLVVDRRDRVELLNPAFGALFAARDARPGRAVLELSRSPALVRFLERLKRSEELLRERMESEAGRTLELRGRSLVKERRVVVVRDLTEQVRLDESRRDLVANVSHELRTPLTAIRGYAENLGDGAMADPDTAARFLDRILAQCARLEALLEDLLALSRLESDRPIDLEPGVDLAELARGALETVRGLADERQVELRFAPESVPAIAGHPESLERLLLNLLENGIKYNREGGRVDVSVKRQGGELLLEVSDTGIGVPRRDLPRIFERFYRVDAGRSRDEGGTGLGLAIVKHAAQLHGGRVEVTSELGRGSVFRIFLPAAGS